MGAPQTDKVRNVVLVGQGGVGKTSVAEAMLHLSGKTARLGGHAGSKPTLDFDPEEVNCDADKTEEMKLAFKN